MLSSLPAREDKTSQRPDYTASSLAPLPQLYPSPDAPSRTRGASGLGKLAGL